MDSKSDLSLADRSDTIVVFADLMQNGLDIGLKALPPTLLDTVMIRSRSYIIESLQRRQDYAALHNNLPEGLEVAIPLQQGSGSA